MEMEPQIQKKDYLNQMGKANAKNKARRDKLTMLNTLRKKIKRARFESKVSELQAKYNSIKSKL